MRVLIVVAHPDDEYAFAATTYRLARELGAVVDQVVISNGEGGYRYSGLAEAHYGPGLTQEEIGRKRLPEIRKRETQAAGRILGIRKHHFLGQKDSGFTLDPGDVDSIWNKPWIRAFLVRLIKQERYQYIFTLLPAADLHGHHTAATDLALEAIQELPEDQRPAVFGADACASGGLPRTFAERGGHPLTRAKTEVYEFHRTQHFGFNDALGYSIIVNWVIAEHKSQGLFQTVAGTHDVERFWLFEASGPNATRVARDLFDSLSAGKGERAAAG